MLNEKKDNADVLAGYEIQIIWKDRKRYLGMPISFTKYKLSQDRLFMETGFFNSKTEEVLLYRVRDIGASRTLGQKLFGVGSVTVKSSDESMPKIILKNIKKSEQVKELLHKLVEDMKIARRMRVGELLDNDIDYSEF